MTTCDMCQTAPATVSLDLTTFGDDTEGCDPMTHLCATCLETLGKS